MSTPARPAPMTEEQIQEDLVRLDAYRGQLNAMVQQHQYLQASRADHVRAKESLEGLERAPRAVEILIPVGGETFVRGTPSNGTKVLIGVGSGVVVETERPRAVEMLAERLTKIDEATQELEGQIRNLDERVQLLSRRLEAVTPGGAGGAAGDAEYVGRD
jgi:prefoldin alpha subunit